MRVGSRRPSSEKSVSTRPNGDSFQLRILEVFECIVTHGPIDPNELARMLGLTKSSVQRATQKLMTRRWILRDPKTKHLIISPLYRDSVVASVTYDQGLRILGEKLDQTSDALGFSFALYSVASDKSLITVALSDQVHKLSNLSEAATLDIARLVLQRSDREACLMVLNTLRDEFTPTRSEPHILWRTTESPRGCLNVAHLPLQTPSNTPAVLRLEQGHQPTFQIAIDAALVALLRAEVRWLSAREFAEFPWQKLWAHAPSPLVR